MERRTRSSPLPSDVVGTTFSHEKGRGFGEGSVMVDRKTNKRYAPRDYGHMYVEDSYACRDKAFAQNLSEESERSEHLARHRYFNLIASITGSISISTVHRD